MSKNQISAIIKKSITFDVLCTRGRFESPASGEKSTKKSTQKVILLKSTEESTQKCAQKS